MFITGFMPPTFKNNPKFKKGKLVIKRVNQFKTIPGRQADTQLTIANEIERLNNKAYNPIITKNMEVIIPHLDIEPSTSFINALAMAEKRISASVSTKRDLKSVLKFITNAAIQLG